MHYVSKTKQPPGSQAISSEVYCYMPNIQNILNVKQLAYTQEKL